MDLPGGFPLLHRFRWAETRKIQVFARMAAGRMSINLQIRRFSWVCGFPPISASPTENWGLNFCCSILLKQCAVYSRLRVDLEVPPISTAPMARNTENPKFLRHGCWKRKHSPANSMILVDLQVSTKFGVSNGKLGLDFLLPISAYKMCHLH